MINPPDIKKAGRSGWTLRFIHW